MAAMVAVSVAAVSVAAVAVAAGGWSRWRISPRNSVASATWMRLGLGLGLG